MPLIPKTNEEHIGIELECLVNRSLYNMFSGFDGLEGIRNKYAKYNSFLEIGTDGSITANKDWIGLEFRILTTPNKMATHLMVVKKILNSLKAKVNKSCGLHVHLDMRHKNVHQAFANLVRSQKLWEPIVRKDRWDNHHCRKISNENFRETKTFGSRYSSINAKSFDKYKTLEVRVHQGTVAMYKIIKWVNLLRACTVASNVALSKAYVMEVA